MNKYKIKTRPYWQDAYLIVGGKNYKDYQKFAEKEFNVEYPEMSDRYIYAEACHDEFKDVNGGKLFTIWIPEFKSYTVNHSILAHECLHMAFSILDHHGIKYHPHESNEEWTHFFEDIYNQCLQKLYNYYL